MIEAWRIVEAAFADTAFDGEGSRRYGGRWHSKGIAVVYTSSDIALATLELLVHLERRVPEYVVFRCYFPEVLVESVDLAQLPPNWRDIPAPAELQQIGSEWVSRRDSAVLQVPSAIIPTSVNYLLNPEHEDFRSIDIGPPSPFTLDPRLRT